MSHHTPTVGRSTSGPFIPTQPGHPPPHTPRPTTATRHMSAGAYLDETFARVSVDEVYHQPRRAVAPSIGFDLGTVLSHCLRAKRISLIRDAVIVGVLLCTLCLSGIGLMFGLVILSGLYGTVALFRLLTDTMRRVAAGEPVTIGRLIRDMFAAGFGLLAAFIGLAFALPALGSLAFFALASDDATVAGSVALVVFGMVLTLLATLGMPVAASVVRWHHAVKHAPNGRPEPPKPDARIHEIQQQQQGNTTVYSGYDPFVGSGVRLATDGFALRLIRPPRGFDDRASEAEREYARPPFATQELVAYVGQQLGHIATAHDPEQRIPQLSVADRIFTAGNETSWLSTMTDTGTVSQLIREPADANRHYLSCQINSWDGELVTSIYVHYVLTGRGLYVEMVTCALAPCHDGYRVVDDVDSIGAFPYLRSGWRGFVNSPATVAAAPINLLREGLRWIIRQTSGARSPRQVPRGFDYGARVSIRELASPDQLRNDFQTQDVAKFRSVVVRRIIAATLDFLTMKEVDVAEFTQRGNVMINSGIYAGGNIGNLSNVSNIGHFNQSHNSGADQNRRS